MRLLRECQRYSLPKNSVFEPLLRTTLYFLSSQSSSPELKSQELCLIPDSFEVANNR